MSEYKFQIVTVNTGVERLFLLMDLQTQQFRKDDQGLVVPVTTSYAEMDAWCRTYLASGLLQPPEIKIEEI